MDKREKVLRGLRCCTTLVDRETGDCVAKDCPYKGASCCLELMNDALEELAPREITPDEWQAWKKAKRRDPLCYMWVGDGTPLWALKPEDIHEPAYLARTLLIFNKMPTAEQRMHVWAQREEC